MPLFAEPEDEVNILNLPLARKVLEFVEIEHEDFFHDQRIFFMTPSMWKQWGRLHRDSEFSGPINKCGTTACLAGTACMLDPDTEVGIDSEGLYTLNGKSGVNWAEHAAGLLGLDDTHLFFVYDNKVAIQILRGYIRKAEAEESMVTE